MKWLLLSSLVGLVACSSASEEEVSPERQRDERARLEAEWLGAWEITRSEGEEASVYRLVIEYRARDLQPQCGVVELGESVAPACMTEYRMGLWGTLGLKNPDAADRRVEGEASFGQVSFTLSATGERLQLDEGDAPKNGRWILEDGSQVVVRAVRE